MWRYISSKIFSFPQYSKIITNLCYISSHHLNRCNMDKMASLPRNTVAWMLIVRQAALPSYAISKLSTTMGHRQWFWTTWNSWYWGTFYCKINNRNQQQCLTICSTPWKGKFSQISGTKKINTANWMKEKADCYIGDSTRTI